MENCSAAIERRISWKVRQYLSLERLIRLLKAVGQHHRVGLLQVISREVRQAVDTFVDGAEKGIH